MNNNIEYIGLATVKAKAEIQLFKETGRMTYREHSITIEFEKPTLRPSMLIDVSECADGAKKYRMNAAWDTGSTSSAISEKLARKMGLQKVESGVGLSASGQSDIYYSYVDLYLSPEMVLRNVKVAQFSLPNHDVDFLIGMDIISQGNFSIVNTGGRMIVEFSMK